jgi:Cys-tRNA(Pro) deacylase
MSKTGQEERAVTRVRDFLARNGLDEIIRETDETIRTVEDAARAVGVPPEEILKSILLLSDEEPVLALMSGPNRVDMGKIKTRLGVRKVYMARPEWVFRFSGYKVGGVPPVGYENQPLTLLDESLFQYDTVWAAAGTDHAFFPVEPDELLRLTGGTVCDIRKSPAPG